MGILGFWNLGSSFPNYQTTQSVFRYNLERDESKKGDYEQE